MDTSRLSASAPPKSNSLFQVFLRLRPPQAGANPSAERFLAVETADRDHSAPTHITLNPPNDRRRAIEKFAFTQVFEEDASQLDIFHCTGVVPLVEGVLAPHGGDGTDALLATLGVTGSGKVVDFTRTDQSSITNRSFTVTHNSRLQVPARYDPASTGRHLPLDKPESPRLRHTLRPREFHCLVRPRRSSPLFSYSLPRLRFCGIFRTTAGSRWLKSAHTYDRTTTLSFSSSS